MSFIANEEDVVLPKKKQRIVVVPLSIKFTAAEMHLCLFNILQFHE